MYKHYFICLFKYFKGLNDHLIYINNTNKATTNVAFNLIDTILKYAFIYA
jgi:hypothetical protein